MSERQKVQKRSRELEKEVQNKRIKRHENDLEKAKQKELRAKLSLEKLDNIPHITSEEDLEKAIQDIEKKT